MADEERRKKKKKSKKKKKRSQEATDVEAQGGGEDEPLTIELGEAEFANNENDHTTTTTTTMSIDDEDAIPSPIEEACLNPDNLAVATAVDTADEDEYIYSAIEFDPDSRPPLHKNRRFRVYTCVTLLVVIAVASVVVIYVTKGAKKTEINVMEIMATGWPSASPTAAPVTDRETSGIIEQLEASVLQGGANFSVIEENDPRYLALNWILHYDMHQLESNDVNLFQRYVLALMGFGLESVEWHDCGIHYNIGPNGTENFINEDCEVKNAATGQIENHKIWLSSTDECEWYGVICSNDGVVRGVELIGNSLIGAIPPEISQLRFLQYLALNGNCLFGKIPSEFGVMPNLLSLELHGNGLSGSVPTELYDATKLQLLNVAMQFEYSGKCLRKDGSLVSTLYARGDPANGYNWGLEGKVLGQNVSRWKSMKGLHLFDNSISGKIGDEIGDLKYLVFLRAHNNRIGGMIPGSITKLTKLREVYIGKNEIYSDLPPDIGDMEDLEDLRVFENEMFGRIPDSLYRLKKLKKLWLQDTLYCEETENDDNTTGWECDMSPDQGFQGSIWSDVGNLKKLSYLIINNNPLTGTLPSEIGQCENLSVLHMHETKIVGTVPEEVCLLRDKLLNSDTGNGIFYADCRPNNRTEEPFIKCGCCSDCCDHTTRVCIADD